MNLAENWSAMPRMDMVFMRNVLIYFDDETKQRILGNVQRLLQPDGLLFLGGAETMLTFENPFETVRFGRTTAYRIRER